MREMNLRTKIPFPLFAILGMTALAACGPRFTGEDQAVADAGSAIHPNPAESYDAGTYMSHDAGSYDSNSSYVSSDAGSSSGNNNGNNNNGGYDSGISYWNDAGAYDSGYYWSDASSSPSDAPPIEERDAGPATDAATEDDAAAEWAWFQLSTDDSTSMATAQLLKLDYLPGNFSLHSHEVINYYDPPASLRSNDAPTTQWQTPEGIVVAMEARPHVVEGSDENTDPEQVFDAGTSSNDGENYASDACGYGDVYHGDIDPGVDLGPEPEPDPVQEPRQGMDMLVHVYAPAVSNQERRPWNLHLCVDVSGSMGGDKIDFVRDALRRLVNHMQAGDKLSLTTFESSAHQIFESLEVSQHHADIINNINGLESTGSTNMIAGLRLAYGNAQSAFDPQAVNRVIVFSDGDANVSNTDIASFAQLTRINNQEGIYLSGVGVGTDYAWERMDALTDAGKGAHVFLPNADEVGVVFGRMLPKLIEVAADQVAIELQLPPGFALEHFSGEEVSTNQQHRVANVVLAAGDDMTLLANYSTRDPEELQQDLIITLRYRPLGSGEPQVFSQRVAIQDLMTDDGSALMRRTELVERYAKWALWQSDEDPELLEIELRNFSPNDSGLIEMANQVQGLRANRW